MKLLQASLVVVFSFNAMAQTAETIPGDDHPSPEGVLIIGERRLSQLREEMWSAEAEAYDLFNQFNDERRFEISCNIHRPTGSRFETQICQPEFERDATREHAQAFLESYRRFLEPTMVVGSGGGPPVIDGASSPSMSAEMAIASRQQAYRQKIRQVAEENPEFLEAIIRYTEARERFERAGSETGRSEERVLP